MAAIKAVRALRTEKNVPPSKKPHMYVKTEKCDVFERGIPFLKKLAWAGDVKISDESPANAALMAIAVTADASLYMPLTELIDIEKELARIKKELIAAQENKQKLEAKLNNNDFLAKAPASVVAAERDKAEKLDSLITKLNESAHNLASMN